MKYGDVFGTYSVQHTVRFMFLNINNGIYAQPSSLPSVQLIDVGAGIQTPLDSSALALY